MTIFGDTYHSDEINPVLEKFVGNNRSEFKVIESELAKIIKETQEQIRLVSDNRYKQKNIDAQAITNSDFNKLIERHIKKIFELNNFNLIWTYSGTVGAFTFPRAITFLSKSRNANGEYSNPKLTATVVLDLALIKYADMTEKELLAIILHEVGHNFYNSVFQLLMNIPMSVTDIMGMMTGNNTKSLFDIIEKFTKSIIMSRIGSHVMTGIFNLINALKDEFPTIAQFLNSAGEMRTEYNAFNRAFSKVVQLIVLKGKIINPLHMVSARSIFGYNAEKFSDSFAVDYGYGVELAKSLEKMETLPKSTESELNSKTMGWLTDIVNAPWELLHRITDEHPDSQNRIRTGLDRLKRARRDPNLPEKLKKQLDQQIEQYEEFYEHYLSIENSNNQRFIFTWLTRVATEKVFKGKLDIRELTYALDPNKYN